MKRCRRCGLEKAEAEFYRVRQNRDGLSSYCKPCQAQYKRDFTKRGKGATSRRWGRPFVERFWEKVDKESSPVGCWLWSAGTNADGYGQMITEGKTKNTKGSVTAHRYSWILHRGPIPAGMRVCHDCPGGDNRLCVNPDHLWLGTDAENVQDAVQKGTIARGDRSGSRTHPERLTHGEQHHSAKLTEQDVVSIRARYATGETIASLARAFGIYDSAIHKVVTRKTWKHLLP